VKLKVFVAGDGDCLLLSSSDGHHALIDGGRSASFQKFAWPELQKLATIDYVIVSHIDSDHISGILWLMKVVAEWTRFDFQTTDGRNRRFPKPATARPPAIKRVWHNAWGAQMQDLAGTIEEFAGQIDEAVQSPTFDLATAPAPAAVAIGALQDLALSIPQGFDLRSVVENKTPVPRNGRPFGDLVMLHRPPRHVKLGRTKLTVIGPGEEHLEALREEWRKWIATRRPDGAGPEHALSSLVQEAQIIENTAPADVTPPNHASITVLAEEDGRTCLLTGDAADDEILDGLSAAGRIVDDRFDCNVLKVQHHGAEHNVDKRFASTVLADHYVFCADGAAENPSPSVVKTITECRAAKEPLRPFTLWFNTAPARVTGERRKPLSDAIAQAKAAAAQNPKITVKVLDRSSPFFELQV
jgi:beta-lactamase superfamily II metal-dependent hydrolase